MWIHQQANQKLARELIPNLLPNKLTGLMQIEVILKVLGQIQPISDSVSDFQVANWASESRGIGEGILSPCPWLASGVSYLSALEE